MKAPNYIFAPNRHKIILSASPFITALTHTFFRMGGAQSGIIPSSITDVLLGISVIVGGLLILPFKPLLFLIVLYDQGSTVIYDLAIYSITLTYSIALYTILSKIEARKIKLPNKINKKVRPGNHKHTKILRPTTSKVILSLTPMLLPLSYTYVDIINRLNPPHLSFILEHTGVAALGIVLLIGYPASAPLEQFFSPLGLWDDMTGIPTHAGLYITGILYGVVIYLTASLLEAIQSILHAPRSSAVPQKRNQ